MGTAFDHQELATLRAHGLAVYRGTLILEARPPITEAERAKVEREIGTRIPEDLLELWNVSFGGTLDYDLPIALGEHVYSASFRELFWPDSNDYNDLFGWIEHEFELLEDAAEEAEVEPPEVLDELPFGGFEYLERLYVNTEEGTRGRVSLYAQGLPPGWVGRLHEDTVATVAPSIPALFEQLVLESDPRAAGDGFVRGREMVDAVDGLKAEHPALANRLDALIDARIVNWRAIVAERPYANTPRQNQAGRIALRAAVEADAPDLLTPLLAQGYPLDRPIQGEMSALAMAVLVGAQQIVRSLLTSGQALGTPRLAQLTDMDLSLVEALIEHGAIFEPSSVTSAAVASVDTALRIVHAGARVGDWDSLADTTERARVRHERDAASVEAGTLRSSRSAEDYRAAARALATLSQQL